MHWRFLNFDFEHAQLAWSDLNDRGPDARAPSPSIRYVNVAKVISPDGSVAYLDLDVTLNGGGYNPPDETRNGLSGKFARINFAPDSTTNLRVNVLYSGATADSCALCEDRSIYPTNATREACYAKGCGCFGGVVTTEAECTHPAMVLAQRKRYTVANFPVINSNTNFPPGSLVGFSVYDLNTGPGGECAEKLTISGYDYYKTPLRPESDNPISSSITFDSATDTFAGTLPGLTTPTDPNSLSDADASQGIQFFYSSSNGFIDATIEIDCVNNPTQTSADILFAGSSSLCAPPPPMPPAPPPPRKTSTTAIGFTGGGAGGLAARM